MHAQPFTIQKKTPDTVYKYSKGTGLSYKFENKQVLEKANVEDQATEKFTFQNYAEFKKVKENDIMISIEHCVNCRSH